MRREEGAGAGTESKTKAQRTPHSRGADSRRATLADGRMDGGPDAAAATLRARAPARGGGGGLVSGAMRAVLSDVTF